MNAKRSAQRDPRHIEYVGRNYQLDDPTRTYAERKLAKLDRFLENPAEVRLTLSLDGHRHIAELHVTHPHGVLQASEETGDMRESILAVIEKAERQARRGRRRAHDRWRRAGREGEPGHRRAKRGGPPGEAAGEDDGGEES